jgi:hypothetical protein
MLNLYYPEIVIIQQLICWFPPFRIARIGLFLNFLVKNQVIFLLYSEHRYVKLFKASKNNCYYYFSLKFNNTKVLHSRFLTGYPTVQLILKAIYGLVASF